MKARRQEDFPEILLPVFPPSCEFSKNLRGCLSIATARTFARATGLRWAGGLALGEGEVIHGRSVHEIGAMGRHIVHALDLTATSLVESGVVSPEASRMLAKPLVPRWLYTRLGNFGWKHEARKNGLGTEDLEARPLDELPIR